MNEFEMMAEIKDANLNYLMLAQQLIRSDKATAIFRLGISKDIADLSTAIKQAAQDRRDLMFIIAADAKATHQDVIRVMDVAGQLGFVNINISTKVPSRGY